MQEIIVIDSQRLNMIQLCARKFDLTFNKSLVPIEKQDFFEKGDLLHRMLQSYYTLSKYRERWGRNGKNMIDIIQICHRIGDHFAIKMILPLDEVEEIKYQFYEYVQYWFGKGDLETLAVEQVASKILFEDEDVKMIYEGKIDWIVRITNVPIMPVDHKTSKRRGETSELSNQFIGYAWLLGSHNVMVNKIGFQKTLSPAQRFERPILSYNQDVIDEWVENSVWWINMIRYHIKSGHYPTNFTSCDKWGGCIFRPICTSERGSRVHKSRQMFETREETWDVGAKL